jgi:polyphosphate kinase
LGRIRPQFLPREVGVLAFDRRVFAQAEDRRVPVLERLRFLCILSSNLDEFFEIRVSELKERIKLGDEAEIPGEPPLAEIFSLVSERAHTLVADQYRLLNKEILPALADEGVRFLAERDWSREQRSWLHGYFLREVIPLLTPIGLDPVHPFPRVLNKSLNLAVQLEGRDSFGRNSGTAIVQAPRALPRVIQLPTKIAGDGHRFVLLTSILQAFIQALFQGMSVRGCYPFRVTRNSDLFLDEEEIKNLSTALAGELPQRHFGDSVRLEVADNMPPELEHFLLEQFQLSAADLYRVDGPVNLVRLMQVPDLVDKPALKFPAFVPGLPKQLEKSPDLFRAIRRGDILLHHRSSRSIR